MEIHSDLVEEAKFALHGRVLRCPLGGNPEDCPMYEIRKLPVEERCAGLESQTREEMVALYEQHNQCLECKLEEFTS